MQVLGGPPFLATLEQETLRKSHMPTSLKIFGCSDDEAEIVEVSANHPASLVYRAAEGTPVLNVWASERATCIDLESLVKAIAQAHPQLLRDALKVTTP